MSIHLALILVLQPLVEGVAVELERPLQASFALNLHNGVGVLHHLDQPNAVPYGQTAIRQHSAHTHTHTQTERGRES